MYPNPDKPKAIETRPDPKADLKSIPMADIKKRQKWSPDGFMDIEAKKRLKQGDAQAIKPRVQREQSLAQL